MVNKTISIPEEIDIRLKKEENASGLITQLLSKYYQIGREMTDEELDKEEEFLKENKELEIKKVKLETEKQLKYIQERREDLHEKAQHDKEVADEREQRIKQNIRENMRSLFHIEELTEEKFEELVEEYYNSKHLFANIYEFMSTREIKAKKF